MIQVSIIMPCHNGEKYIESAINSVKEQTFKDWELIIINDCSTDNSIWIAESFAQKDSRIKVLNTKESTGFPADVRNLGIEAAQGRYIAFLDCDDEWLPTKLEHQIPLFNDEKNAVVFSWYKKINENGKLNNKDIKAPVFVTYKKLLGGNVIGNLTGIYDTKKVGKVYQKQIHHEDYLMWLEILKQGYVAINTKSVEAVYRESKTSLSGNKLKAIVWTWNIFYKELNMGFFTSILSFIRYAIKGVLKFCK